MVSNEEISSKDALDKKIFLDDDENKKIDFKKNFKIYFNLLKPFKWYVGGIIFFVIIVSLVELLHKYIFKELIDNATLFANNTLALSQFTEILLFLLIIFVISSIIQVVGQWVRLFLINVVESKILYTLKTNYYNHIIGLSHGFHSNHKTGSLISRLTRGSIALERITDILMFSTMFLVTTFIFSIISLILIDFTSSILLLIMAIIFVAYSLFISFKGEKYNISLNLAEDNEKAFIGDTITNIETIKFFGKELKINKDYSKLGKTTKNKQFKFWMFSNWMVSGHWVIMDLFTIIIIGQAIIRLINNDLSIGSVAFIYTVYLSVSYALTDFSWRIKDLYAAITDFDSITMYGNVSNEIKDDDNAKAIKISNGEIVFEKICFKYKDRKILDKFNLNVEKNQKIAIVGHSGSGKTTLVKLLYRFYDLQKGRILIDGQDIKKVKQESLRNEMSIVPQEGILFNDTIYNNIIFSNPSATKKEVIRVIKQAQFHKFIQKLPLKENTIVGERGVKLSGGEKQRLSIARALLANKKILVLDEATSALDSKTENEIQKALFELMKNRTTIIIAHRLSTIMHADKIIVMNEGRIVQEGKHEDLLKQKGHYKELWKLQKDGYLQEKR